MPITKDQVATRLQPLPEAIYACDIPLTSIERNLDLFGADYGIDLAPDFQRGHVWSRAQQEAYVTALLRGALTKGLTTIQWNSPAFGHHFDADVAGLHPRQLVIVDGLQRLTAVRAFVAGVITVVDGLTCDDLRASGYLDFGHQLRFVVLALRTRADLLKYYLDLNTGGTVHSAAEIARVQSLLAQETATPQKPSSRPTHIGGPA